jgi:hypothetical protein
VENTKELGHLDKSRFAVDAAYRRSVRNLNLLTYLIAHADTRPSNFIISRGADDPRALSIDNGLAFGGLTNPRTLICGEWRNIVVPSLARDKVERLRRLTPDQLDTLRVVAQFEIQEGQLVPVQPTAAFNESGGVRWENNVVQFGLTRQEISAIEKRRDALLKSVASGKIQVY